MKVTDDELIITANKQVIARQGIGKISGKIYLHFLGRTKGDSFEVERDKDLSPDHEELNH